VNLARKIKRQKERAEIKKLKKSGDPIAGMRMLEDGDPQFDAVMYCLAKQKQGGTLAVDLSAYRPAKAAEFWQRVAELEGVDLSYLQGLADKGQSAGKAKRDAEGKSQSGASAPSVNLRI